MRRAEDSGSKARHQRTALGETGTHDADVDLDVGPDACGGVVACEVGRGRELEQVNNTKDLHDDDEDAGREHGHDAELFAQGHVESPEFGHGHEDGRHVEDDGGDGGPEGLGLYVAADGIVGAVPAQPCAGDGCALEDGDDDEGGGADGGEANDDKDADAEFFFREDA